MAARELELGAHAAARPVVAGPRAPRSTPPSLVPLAFSVLSPRRCAASSDPAGWEEGLFDVVAAGLPQSSVSVLVTPRGKFLAAGAGDARAARGAVSRVG
jgi:hypothetical protein